MANNRPNRRTLRKWLILLPAMLLLILGSMEIHARRTEKPRHMPASAWDFWWPGYTLPPAPYEPLAPDRPDRGAHTVFLCGDSALFSPRLPEQKRLQSVLAEDMVSACPDCALRACRLGSEHDLNQTRPALIIVAIDYPRYLADSYLRASDEYDAPLNRGWFFGHSTLVRTRKYERQYKSMLDTDVSRGKGVPDAWGVFLKHNPARTPWPRRQRRALRHELTRLRDRVRPWAGRVLLVSLPDRLLTDYESRTTLWSSWPAARFEWDFDRIRNEPASLARIVGIPFLDAADLKSQWTTSDFIPGTGELNEAAVADIAAYIARSIREMDLSQQAYPWDSVSAWFLQRIRIISASKLTARADPQWCMQHLDDPDGSRVLMAAMHLDQPASRELKQKLVSALDTPDCPARLEVARAVDRLMPEDAPGILLRRTQDRCPEVAAFAIEHAGLISFQPQDARHRFGNYPQNVADGKSALHEDLLDLPPWGDDRDQRWQQASAEEREELLVAAAVPEWPLQVRAICSLAGCRAQKSLQALTVRASGDLDPRVRRAACWALAWDQSTQAKNALEQALDYPDPRVRAAALWALGRYTLPHDPQTAMRILFDDADRSGSNEQYGPWLWEPVFTTGSKEK